MNYKSVILGGAIFIAALPLSLQAEGVDFTLGGGLPFFIVPELSLAAKDDEQRWFVNYKMGLDDGFSVGFEQGIGTEDKHAIGVFIGAIGVQDDERDCEASDDDLATSIGNAFACVLFEAFDEETTNGLGLSYSYNFSGLNHSGMRLRFEIGYGEGSNSHEKRIDGGIVVSYQF